jgi:hypothetical protein
MEISSEQSDAACSHIVENEEEIQTAYIRMNQHQECHKYHIQVLADGHMDIFNQSHLPHDTDYKIKNSLNAWSR